MTGVFATEIQFALGINAALFEALADAISRDRIKTLLGVGIDHTLLHLEGFLFLLHLLFFVQRAGAINIPLPFCFGRADAFVVIKCLTKRFRRCAGCFTRG
ncbi:hypothetical protein N579_08220 [Corynebacterium pseudodiphtheriticum 090104]|nr:hypothetical protein N579_08220 [Corynebacterium pseudodiphtheriticum 090104]